MFDNRMGSEKISFLVGYSIMFLASCVFFWLGWVKLPAAQNTLAEYMYLAILTAVAWGLLRMMRFIPFFSVVFLWIIVGGVGVMYFYGWVVGQVTGGDVVFSLAASWVMAFVYPIINLYTDERKFKGE